MRSKTKTFLTAIGPEALKTSSPAEKSKLERGEDYLLLFSYHLPLYYPKMINFRKIALDFVEDFKANHNVVGALVCGSFVTGNPSERSDIDLHIILTDEAAYRERGNVIREGTLLEYFANPPKQLRKYFADDYKSGKPMSLVQFSTGEVLFDNSGVLTELKQEAQELLKRKRPTPPGFKIELWKYTIWDLNDNLQDAFESNAEDFSFVYHISLSNLFTIYCDFVGYPNHAFRNILSILRDENKRRKYLLADFPDQGFSSMFVQAITEQPASAQAQIFSKISKYVLNKMGGFEIDGWYLKSPLDV